MNPNTNTLKIGEREYRLEEAWVIVDDVFSITKEVDSTALAVPYARLKRVWVLVEVGDDRYK